MSANQSHNGLARVDFRTLNDEGVRLRLAGRYEEAEATLRLAANASDHHYPHNGLGNLYLELGQLAEAEEAYREALRRSPDYHPARTGLALVLLALGRYAEAWPLHESRRYLPDGANLPLKPEWTGEPVAGRKIALWPEQGLGDQIMCSRFAVQLREQGADVTMVCHPRLVRLFSGLGVKIVSHRAALPFEPPDFASLIMSVPLHMGTTIETIPPPAPLAAAGQRRGKIGVIWHGNSAHKFDGHRSLPRDFADKLLCLPGAISLHPEETGATDLQDTADIIAGLDLVISVDTSGAHLAASLGKPTLILLSARGTDWRWLRDRTDSPWYPAVRLIRQSRSDWRSVLDEIQSALATA